MRVVLSLMLAVLPALAPAGCGGCEDVGCSHPLGLLVEFPEASPDEPVSLAVEYDDERRFISCPSSQDVCEVTCGNQACEQGDRDVVVSRNAGTLELAIGHMSQRPSDGESSCRGAETITVEVSRGRATFQPVELEVVYARDELYGGPGCGYAEQTQSRTVSLTLE